MKLYTTDNSELMEITTITAENGVLVVSGTIMGAVPVKAILKPEDMRMALTQMSPATMAQAAMMPLRGTPVPWIAGLLGLAWLWRCLRGR